MNRTAHEIRFLSSVATHEAPLAHIVPERYSATNETGQRAHPSRREHVVGQCALGHDNSVIGVLIASVDVAFRSLQPFAVSPFRRAPLAVRR